MRLDWFMLADSAVALDGKHYIHGGGLSRINTPGVPMVQPQLAVATRLLMGAEDIGEHRLDLEVLAPDEGGIISQAHVGFVVGGAPPDLLEGEPWAGNFTFTLGNLLLPAEGVYRVYVSVDDELRWEEPFAVRVLQHLVPEAEPEHAGHADEPTN